MTAPRGSRTLRELMLAVASQDDREAFNELVDLLTSVLTRSAHAMVRPDYCEDLVQETWYRAWKYRRTYRGDAEPRTWLHRIMSRAAATDRSLRPTTGSASTDDLVCTHGSVDLEAVFRADAIDRALARLESGEAMLIRRRWLAEEDWATITREMGFASLYQARKTYMRAMRKLRALHS